MVRFLLPVGGVVDPRFGILTTHQHKSVPAGILAGMEWAADNCAFSHAGFNADIFFPWLASMTAFRSTCLFVVVPDVVGDATATLDRWVRYAPQMAGWPLAFVA